MQARAETCPTSHVLQCVSPLKTVWPSGLRRCLQAPVRKGVSSNPTAVTFSCTCDSSPDQEPPNSTRDPRCFTLGILAQGRVRGSSRAGCRQAQAWSSGLPIPFLSLKQQCIQDTLAEWSKALASGASPQGREFEPHNCHSLCSTTLCA